MKKFHISLLAIVGLNVLSSNVYAESLEKSTSQKHQQYNKQKKANKKAGEKNNSLQKLSYMPPFMGGSSSTSRLVGMALRGSINELVLSVLTPAHTGLSIKAQPDIYWYVSTPTSKPFKFVEFVLNSEHVIKPILREHLPHVRKAGIQKLSLSDFNIKLEPDVEYTWVISLVPDPGSRTLDIVTSGKIKYVVPDSHLLKTVSTTLIDQQPTIFAQEGYWYDAFAGIIEQTIKKPTQSAPRENLVSLLKQVELDQIAKNVSNRN
jgi:hypothetical protein